MRPCDVQKSKPKCMGEILKGKSTANTTILPIFRGEKLLYNTGSKVCKKCNSSEKLN